MDSGESNTDSVVKRPVVLANPSAVTIAFRELQDRAKILESERDEALKKAESCN